MRGIDRSRRRLLCCGDALVAEHCPLLVEIQLLQIVWRLPRQLQAFDDGPKQGLKHRLIRNKASCLDLAYEVMYFVYSSMPI